MERAIIPVLILALFLGAASHAHEEAENSDKAGPSAAEELSVSGTPGITERLGGIAAVDAVLIDEQGKQVRIGDLLKVPTILLPVFYSCSDVCSFLQANVAGILPRVDLEPVTEFQVISMSFDSSETPEDARQARTDFLNIPGREWPASSWRFLTGDEKNIVLFMESIGFRYQRRQGQFVHPVVIVALAPGGRIARYLYGYDPLPFDLTMAMTEAGKGRTGLSVKRALTYCFSYDPESRHYTVNVLRIAGAAVVLLAVTLFLALTLGGRRKWKTRQ